jgi:hypothetical protein
MSPTIAPIYQENAEQRKTIAILRHQVHVLRQQLNNLESISKLEIQKKLVLQSHTIRQLQAG